MASKKKGAKKKSAAKSAEREFSLMSEVVLLLVLAAAIILFLCNIGKGGAAGSAVSAFFFGAFGAIAYVFPFWLFFLWAFLTANWRNRTGKVKMKVFGGILLLIFLSVLTHLAVYGDDNTKLYNVMLLCIDRKNGGGLVGAGISRIFLNSFGIICSWVITVIALLISIVLLTEISFLSGIRRGGEKARETLQEDSGRRRKQQEEKKEERKKEKERRADRKVRGVAVDDTTLKPKAKKKKGQTEDMSEVTLPEEENIVPADESDAVPDPAAAASDIPDQTENFTEYDGQQEPEEIPSEREDLPEPEIYISGAPEDEPGREETVSEEVPEQGKAAVRRTKADQKAEAGESAGTMAEEIEGENVIAYEFPPVTLLKPGDPNAIGDSRRHLQEMSNKLQQTLTNFGVNARVTNVTCGPAVTRYEIQPEMGVKVSKIVGLADDIKLNLAVMDIRIEAPIPGKAAIGIEVPNKENVTVALRDLIESPEFKAQASKLSIAVGKDIAGKVIMADIAKMPHLLIAGATGSGKSVCINTIIMSILYKADPNEVKLIMIDPKVVELSVYNGIPHLFIPVVTDPKNAAGALHWAVSEMTDRYRKFAEYNVRDLKGYNEKIDALHGMPEEEKPKKMPQIVIIVDELADLMMVAPGDVEDAICRLAQLARAAGIHLIIATQRPSVNVITGLIKANMPSRIAFAVTSGVDSRTILDMNGAEKLLGKGDMLFYPQGYAKPVRVQGAFVSDKEVADVVGYLTQNNRQVSYDTEVQEKVKSAAVSATGGGSGFSAAADERDVHFAEAGRFLIEKEKGSIGMLQRMFKVGFNRAARIMDQLEEAGVVGPEEGTKPRRVLMTMEEFGQYLDENE